MNVAAALTSAFATRLGRLEVTSHVIAPWHSATFSGARHAFGLVTEMPADVQLFAREIAEAEIDVPGGFVADVAVTPCPTGDGLRLTIDVLTITT